MIKRIKTLLGFLGWYFLGCILFLPVLIVSIPYWVITGDNIGLKAGNFLYNKLDQYDID